LVEARTLGSGYLLDEVIRPRSYRRRLARQIAGRSTPVAVKVLRAELGDDPEIVARGADWA
jgi:hypothetical protein